MKKISLSFFLLLFMVGILFPEVAESNIFRTPNLSSTIDIEELNVDFFSMLSFNSDYPSSIKADGSLWQGKGLSFLLRPQLAWYNEWVSFSLAPEIWGAQNLDYDHPVDTSSNGDYWWGLDRLSSFGDGFYWSPDLGQSEIRVRQWGMTAGLGTRNVVFGPAVIQNLILSADGSGIPMLDLGTDGPIITDWGTFDARLFWGQSRQSSFYNSDPSDDLRLFTGGVFNYTFPFLPDMNFGFIRAFHSPWSTLTLWKTFEVLLDTIWKEDRGIFGGGPGLEDDVDQVLSFVFDWKLPLYKARIYTEIGRNDHSGNLTDFLMQPDHSLAWSAGIEKIFDIGAVKGFQLSVEVADTGINMGTVIRPTGSWYRHDTVVGGYTNLGQLLGATMGPGSNFQGAYLSQRADFYFIQIGVERLNNDTDYFYSIYNWATQPHWKYNLMINYILSGSIKIQSWEIGTACKLTQNWNHNFVFGDFRTNVHFEISTRLELGQ